MTCATLPLICLLLCRPTGLVRPIEAHLSKQPVLRVRVFTVRGLKLTEPQDAYCAAQIRAVGPAAHDDPDGYDDLDNDTDNDLDNVDVASPRLSIVEDGRRHGSTADLFVGNEARVGSSRMSSRNLASPRTEQPSPQPLAKTLLRNTTTAIKRGTTTLKKGAAAVNKLGGAGGGEQSSRGVGGHGRNRGDEGDEMDEDDVNVSATTAGMSTLLGTGEGVGDSATKTLKKAFMRTAKGIASAGESSSSSAVEKATKSPKGVGGIDLSEHGAAASSGKDTAGRVASKIVCAC
jgi:hypothetical protein